MPLCEKSPSLRSSSEPSNQFKPERPAAATARWAGALRRTPFRRKKPFWARSKHPKSWDKNEARANEKQRPKAILKKETAKRAREKRDYYALCAKWLPLHPVCGICLVRGVEKPRRATEVHHYRGRLGRLLCDTRFFISSCRDCREFPHEHPKEARELGILSSPAEWNVYPGDPEN